MKRLLLVLLAFSLFGCSGSTEPGSGSPHKIPKVGSTFTMRLSYRQLDTIRVHTVMVTGLRYNGKSNVLMTTDSNMFAFEDNGDISIPIDWDGGWLRIPLVSRKDTVLEPSRRDESPTLYILTERTVKFLGEKTLVVGGKNYESLRFEILTSDQPYDQDGKIGDPSTFTYRMNWIPEIGYIGATESAVSWDNDAVTQQLIAFDLK